ASGRLVEYSHSSLQRQIVSHAKEPAVDVVAGLASLQMVKECEEGLLHNIFAVLHGDAKAHSISQQSCPHEVEEVKHFIFQGDVLAHPLHGGTESKTDSRVG